MTNRKLTIDGASAWIQDNPKAILAFAATAVMLLGAGGLAMLGSFYSPSTEGVALSSEGNDDLANEIPEADQKNIDGKRQSPSSRDISPEAQEGGGATSLIAVHVVGCVKNPGLYELTSSARCLDAVIAAGGFSTNASQESINLAEPLYDGAQLRVPSKKEVAKDDIAYGISGPISSSAGSGSTSGSAGGGLVNINTADGTLLESLPGIGPSTSAKIIADREANGPYASLNDLMRVSGIGEKKVESLRGLAETK